MIGHSSDSEYEPLAVPIARSYPITTVQFFVTGGFFTRLWGSEVARCTQRDPPAAAAGDCDEPEYNTHEW